MSYTTHEAPERIWIDKVHGQHPEDWNFTDGKHLTKRQLSDKVEYVRSERIEELEAELAKAVEALKFYANADNYEDQHKPESCGCCYYLHDAEIKEDEGAKARTTLAELKGQADG